MSFVLLLSCPRCRARFSALSTEAVPLSCSYCDAEFNDSEYGILRFRAGIVARELEQLQVAR